MQIIGLSVGLLCLFCFWMASIVNNTHYENHCNMSQSNPRLTWRATLWFTHRPESNISITAWVAPLRMALSVSIRKDRNTSFGIFLPKVELRMLAELKASSMQQPAKLNTTNRVHQCSYLSAATTHMHTHFLHKKYFLVGISWALDCMSQLPDALRYITNCAH